MIIGVGNGQLRGFMGWGPEFPEPSEASHAARILFARLDV